MSRSIANPEIQPEHRDSPCPAEHRDSPCPSDAARTRTVTHPSAAGLPTREGEAPAELQLQVRELLELLSALHELLKRLLELARAKVDAMRGADAVGLQRCAAEECGLLERLFEHEDQRNAAFARLAQSLHWNDVARVRLSDIAERLPEPFSSRLRARTAGLRRTADELRQKNRLAAEVARHLHDHIRAVFEEVARVNQESVVYGPSGKHEQRTNETWVDAVG